MITTLQPRKRGRPPGTPTQPVSIRLTAAQRAYCLERGGTRFVRDTIDKLMKKEAGKK